MKKLRINILSPGRFHVCDLARELSKNGFDVKFYSFVPTKRAMKFGLPKECSASLFYPLIPFLAISKKLFPKSRMAAKALTLFQDWLTSVVMRRCDICISMSGSFVRAPRKAKRQGAVIIIERGSKHICEQKLILDSIPSNKEKVTVPYWHIPRELECYDMADYVAVASEHVVRSMVKYGFPKEKLFINPYGVDLSMFYPDPKVEKQYDVIMVGGWGYRKGCDLIVEALKDTDLKFLHVGGLVDMEFPDLPNFTHVPPVDQSKLIEYYNKAKIAILPSREEGLAMVQAQAIACNLPLVGSIDSGAEDLKKKVKHPEYITIIDEYTPEKTREAIESTLQQYQKLGSTIYAGDAVNNLTWQAYGKRYAEFLKQITTEQ